MLVSDSWKFFVLFMYVPVNLMYLGAMVNVRFGVHQVDLFVVF